MALTMTTLPIMANDYLKIYFKDGHTERHYMKLVESISTTKYDLEGNLHDDYQMQQIIMKDTTYSYYIADIDSMSFTKVDEEKLKKNVENVRNSVTSIFEQCTTVEEMEKHTDEINIIEGVEDVRRSGTNIIVKVRDWYNMVFMYPIVPEDEGRSMARKAKSLDTQDFNRQVQHIKKDGTPIKVVIACHMVNDSRFKDQVQALKDLRDEFEEMGVLVDFIPSEKSGNLDMDFYSRRMFEYDIVILDTHGGYDEDSGLHGFLTGEYLGISTPQIKFWNWVDKYLDKYGLYGIDPITIDIDDAFIGTCWTDYLSSGVFIGVWEKFIGKNSPGFGEGPHIVFNGACESLEGEGTLIRANDGKVFNGNKSVAEKFFKKGADIYMGYIGEVKYSGYTARDFFNTMLQGASQEVAFDVLDNGLKYEETGHKASLIDVIYENSEIDPKRIFLYKTQTVDKSNQEMNEEYKEKKKVVLKGITSCYDLGNKYPQFGFRIAMEPDVDESSDYTDILSKDAHYTGTEVGEVAFSAQFDPEPGKIYYYRACTYDGIHFNWGEEKRFKIEKPAETGIITFADPNVKNLCIRFWDTDRDGELSREEAAAVKKLSYFSNQQDIISFNELQYFTGLTSIKENDFYGCSSLTSITIPISVTSIEGSAFNGCSSLTSITIPNSVTSIGGSAFSGCSALTSITIPNNVTSIGAYSFNKCSGLTSVTIPNGVTSIGYQTFSNCSSLTSVTIGSGVNYINIYAFYGCSKLTDVYCMSEYVPTAASDAFKASPIKSATLHVPAASLDNYKNTEPWKNFGTIVGF